MSKKIISLILCGILVFCSFSICFAVSTDSAIKATKELKVSSDLRATGQEVYPNSSSYTYYYFGNSGVLSSSGTMSTWGQLITNITNSIANSCQSIYLRLYPYIDQLEGYTDGIEGLLGTISNSITSINNQFNSTGLISNMESYQYSIDNEVASILSILQNGMNIKLGSPWQPYFMPTDNYNFNSSDWRYYHSRTVEPDGRLRINDIYETNMLIMLKRILYDSNNNLYQLYRDLGAYVRYDNYTAKIYNTDLTTTNLPMKSLWYDIRYFGENISMHLARLSYVLASDEEIEARQAAAANQDAVVDDFIKPTGSGSASASDFADVASIGGDMKDALTSNVSPSSAFTSLSSSSDAWGWFSQSTANSLDTTNNTREVYPTPHLDSYYNDLLQTLRFK